MNARPLRGIHVFWMVFAFFAVVIGVDAFFISRAVATFPGEQVKNSYVLGLDYNREVESRDRQAHLGWTAQAGVQVGNGRILAFHLTNRDGAPVTGLSVIATCHIIGASGGDQDLLLSETSAGTYAAPLAIRDEGRIELTFKARREPSGAIVFQAGKTLVLS